jgi:hypothetical protein
MTLPLDTSAFFSGSNISYSATDLPGGLSIDPVSGVISGVPVQPETQAVTVTAANAAGQAQQNFTWTITDAASPPDQVVDLSATAGDGEITLAWTAPADNGAAITGYVIERRTGGGSFIVVADGISAVPGFIDIGLSNDVLHDYRVAAVNSEGGGAVSAIVSATPVASGAVAVNTFDSANDPGFATTYTFTGVNVGTGTVLIGATGRGSIDNLQVTSLTIDGTPANLVGLTTGNGATSGSLSRQQMSMHRLSGMTAGQVDIEVTFNVASSRCGIVVWTLENAGTMAFGSAPSGGTGVDITASIDVPADGMLLAHTMVISSTTPFALVGGVDERMPRREVDASYHDMAADRAYPVAETGVDVTLDIDTGTNTTLALVAVASG